MSETVTDLPANTPAEGNAPETEGQEAAPPPALEQKPEPKPEPKPWQGKFEASQRRRAQEAEQRAAAAEAELQRLRTSGPAQAADPNDPAEIRRQAEESATQRMRAEAEARQFNDACNATAQKISAEFGQDGLKAAASGWTNAGMDLDKPNHRALLSLLTEVDDGPKLYHRIGTDPDFAAHLLEMSPLKAAFEIAKLLPREQAKEVIAEAKAAAEDPAQTDTPATHPAAAQPASKAPPISSAPRPSAQAPASRGTPASSRDIFDPKISTEDYARIRAEQRKARSAY